MRMSKGPSPRKLKPCTKSMDVKEGYYFGWLVPWGVERERPPPPNPPKKTRRMHITYPRCLVQLVRRHAQVQQHACCVVWEEGGIMSQ